MGVAEANGVGGVGSWLFRDRSRAVSSRLLEASSYKWLSELPICLHIELIFDIDGVFPRGSAGSRQTVYTMAQEIASCTVFCYSMFCVRGSTRADQPSNNHT